MDDYKYFIYMKGTVKIYFYPENGEETSSLLFERYMSEDQAEELINQIENSFSE